MPIIKASGNMKKKNKAGQIPEMYPDMARAIQLDMVLRFPLLAGCFVTVHREPWGLIVYKLQATGTEMAEYLERVTAIPQTQRTWYDIVERHRKAFLFKNGGRVS